ncbi:nuclear transport factor 2 family protein [Actinomadura chibensis]|uniref:Nuclear transport factor 2 family protein n=1 Tax=Actinomadura chibensis TaxID=392828 RepID=A0A5D0ND08_9ACTN|nr:nuclear transport factor 2 family protein [Actinomadura chibensis]TYB42169.1 nuclear transport factor 2 family protein [Actinomadura chibensis]
MHPFRAAAEAGDQRAIEALLADDVVFTSPVAFKPYPGKPITVAILRAVLRVFTDLRYFREIGAPDDRDHALLFKAKVGDLTITGCDFLRTNDAGLIEDLTVMVRPLSAAKALADAMAAEFDQVRREVAAAAD